MLARLLAYSKCWYVEHSITYELFTGDVKLVWEKFMATCEPWENHLIIELKRKFTKNIQINIKIDPADWLAIFMAINHVISDVDFIPKEYTKIT